MGLGKFLKKVATAPLKLTKKATLAPLKATGIIKDKKAAAPVAKKPVAAMNDTASGGSYGTANTGEVKQKEKVMKLSSPMKKKGKLPFSTA